MIADVPIGALVVQAVADAAPIPTYVSSMSLSNVIRELKSANGLVRKAAASIERIAAGSAPAAMPPSGAISARLGDSERETSTNAQMQGAADEPWGGNR